MRAGKLFLSGLAAGACLCSLAAQPASPAPDLGPGASLHGRAVFPTDNPWNLDVSRWPVAANSTALVASIGFDKSLHADFGTTYGGVPNGIPYLVVDAETVPAVPVVFANPAESDSGPYPIPLEAPVEGGAASTGDRHVIVLDRQHWRLYELFDAHADPASHGWRAGSGAVFDLASNALRPATWTSADAAGLPIFPGLVRYDETCETGAIRHALRFTCARTRRAFVAPARHFASASNDPALPPMGLRVRLRAGYNISGFSPPVRVILTALKTYGMILADNGSDWFLSGAPDARWNDDELATLHRVRGADFEVVDSKGESE